MFDLVASFPRAGGELIDFHLKSEYEGYLSALHEVSGRKLFVAAENGTEVAAALRRLILLADLVIFTAHEYAISPDYS